MHDLADRPGERRFFITFSIVALAAALAACAGEEAEEPPQPAVGEPYRGSTGCVIERLTDAPFDEFQVQGAGPDGTFLFYAWEDGEDDAGAPRRGATLLNLETGEATAMEAPINNSGAFSPDGRFVTGAQYTEDGRTDIYELELATGAVSYVAPGPDWDWLPSYSPDGRWIVFNSYRAGNSELYLVERKSALIRRLTENEVYDAHGEFSPDGGRILFHRNMGARADGTGYDYDIFSYDLAAGTETRLTDSPAEEAYGSWAPDGGAFVFSSDANQAAERHDLFVRDLDDHALHRLTDGDWKDSYAFWTRDGRYIYFNSNRFGNSDIFRMKMRGRDCERAG